MITPGDIHSFDIHTTTKFVYIKFNDIYIPVSYTHLGRTAEAVHINSMLESIRSTVHQHYHALMAQDGYVTAELVKNAFLGKIARERTLIEFFKQHNEQ